LLMLSTWITGFIRCPPKFDLYKNNTTVRKVGGLVEG